MASIPFPRFLPQAKTKRTVRTCPAHRAWVRRHYCSVPNCKRLPIESAHVRDGTDGGAGMKPSDCWVISLCTFHHLEQHRIGERAFQEKHSIDLLELAKHFARRSPHWLKLSRMQGALTWPT
jgi:hypothetical protein